MLFIIVWIYLFNIFQLENLFKHIQDIAPDTIKSGISKTFFSNCNVYVEKSTVIVVFFFSKLSFLVSSISVI